jgi:hypothetical protein
MKIIPTRVHGAIDYLWSALLIASPWLLDFARYQEETWTAVTLGIAAILYSLLTDYEMGAVGALSMKTHLALDMVAGLLLATSPWVLGFADFVWAPHVAFGLAAVATAAITRTRVLEHAPVGV